MSLRFIYEKYKNMSPLRENVIPLHYWVERTPVFNEQLFTFEDERLAGFYIIMLTYTLFKKYLNEYKLYDESKNTLRSDFYVKGVLVPLTINQLVKIYGSFKQELFKCSNWTFVRECGKWIPDGGLMLTTWEALGIISSLFNVGNNFGNNLGNTTLFVNFDYAFDEFENLCYTYKHGKREIFISSSDCIDTLKKKELMGML